MVVPDVPDEYLKDNYEKLLAIQLLEQFRTGQNISISEIEAVFYKNVLRVYKQVLG